MDGEAHDVAVNDGHAVEIPVLGMTLDDFVEHDAVLEDAADEGVGEESGGEFFVGGGGSLDLFAPGGAMGFQRGIQPGVLPKGLECGFEIFGRVDIILKQELHGPFPGLAPLTHGGSLKPGFTEWKVDS